MADFRYVARADSGERVTGVLDAETEAAALRLLSEKRLFPISVTEHVGVAHAGSAERLRVRGRDVGILYGQLADLIGSGVPLLRALDSLVRSTVNRRLSALMKEIRAAVADGKALSEAMKAYPATFPLLHIAMIQAGERAAFLEDVLRSLSQFLERLDDLRGKVLGAMIYPLLLSVVGTAVLIGALVFFVPRFEPLLEGVDKALPTQLIFGLSDAVRGYWYLIAFGLAAVTVWLVGVAKTDRGKEWLEYWRFKIPVAGMAMRLVAITRFCRILGTMLANGVPMLQALNIAKDATGSPLLGVAISEAAENVRAGKSLTEPLAAGKVFPDQILAMIAVAEESNRLDKVLLQIADTVERRTNRQVDQAVRLVEPVILCLVAAAIGFLALGLLLPIFTMASSLGGAS